MASSHPFDPAQDRLRQGEGARVLSHSRGSWAREASTLTPTSPPSTRLRTCFARERELDGLFPPLREREHGFSPYSRGSWAHEASNPRLNPLPLRAASGQASPWRGS